MYKDNSQLTIALVWSEVWEKEQILTLNGVVTWFKTHKIYKSHINYSIAYPKPQNKKVLLGDCSHFMSLKPTKNLKWCYYGN